MATTTNWCATAESNKPRTGNPWLTSGKVSGGGADSACISLISETSMGFSMSSGGGFILQFLGLREACKQQLLIKQLTDFRWNMFRRGLHHLKSVALIMPYEVAAFKSLVIPGVTAGECTPVKSVCSPQQCRFQRAVCCRG